MDHFALEEKDKITSFINNRRFHFWTKMAIKVKPHGPRFKRFEFWTKMAKVTKPQGPKWEFTLLEKRERREGCLLGWWNPWARPRNPCINHVGCGVSDSPRGTSTILSMAWIPISLRAFTSMCQWSRITNPMSS
ncbi:hypothetical protein Hanom_Chr13g01194521 [Helianthus anomalus]